MKENLTGETDWRDRTIHLVGVGGIGMSALAQVLRGRGAVVSGSDLNPSPLTERLVQAGIRFFPGHSSANIEGKELVVASAAIPEDNVELEAARRLGKPIWSRARLLAEVSRGYRTLAIAGTHGKTTITSMLGWALTQAGYDPTIIAGGVMQNFGSNARVGRGRWLVVEADEYERTFLELSPQMAIVTNIEFDHPDCFASLSALEEAFGQFARRILEGGVLIGCGDDSRVRALALQMAQSHGRSVQLYGLGDGTEWRARQVETISRGGVRFQVLHRGQVWGEVELDVPGIHNVVNSLAVVAAAQGLGVEKKTSIEALAGFRGVARRFEVLGEAQGVTIIDDYAHHPTEVKATLSAARGRYPECRIWAVFQPHTFSRTEALLEELKEAFHQADGVIITDIYPAREVAGPDSITGQALAEAITGPQVLHMGRLDEVVSYLAAELRPQDIVITLNAGDGRQAAESLLRRLEEAG